MGIISVSIESELGFLGAGIWTGIFFLITGGLGMLAAKNKTTGFITAFMIMSILSSIAALYLLVVESIAAASENDCHKVWIYSYCSGEGGKVALHALMAFIGFVEGIVALISSGLTCRACCCAPLPQTGQVMYVPATGVVQYVSPHTTYVTTGANVQYATPQVITTQYHPQYTTQYTSVIQA